MRPIVYVRPRTVWTFVKVAAWLVVFSILSAHKGNGAAVFLFASLGYLILRAWTRRRNRRPVPPESQITDEDALRMLRLYQYLRAMEELERSRSDEPQQIQARRTP